MYVMKNSFNVFCYNFSYEKRSVSSQWFILDTQHSTLSISFFVSFKVEQWRRQNIKNGKQGEKTNLKFKLDFYTKKIFIISQFSSHFTP